METKNDESASQHLNKMRQELANFMVLYEQTEERFKNRKDEMDQQLISMKTEMQTQLNEMRAMLTEINEVMSMAGAARWRLAAEEAMKQGEEHLLAIKEACNIYKKLAEDSVSRLEHISISTEKRVSAALHHLNEETAVTSENYRRKSEESYLKLENTADNAISSIKKIMRWLQFERIVTAVVAALLAAFLTALYVNAEWPWESYQKSKQERVLGQHVLAVWPTLTPSKQDQLKKLIGPNI